MLKKVEHTGSTINSIIQTLRATRKEAVVVTRDPSFYGYLFNSFEKLRVYLRTCYNI
jgi:hypothetical protein